MVNSKLMKYKINNKWTICDLTFYETLSYTVGLLEDPWTNFRGHLRKLIILCWFIGKLVKQFI